MNLCSVYVTTVISNGTVTNYRQNMLFEIGSRATMRMLVE